MPDVEVMILSDLERAVAIKIGQERAAYADRRRYHSRHPEAGKRTSSAENHILGVAAELAVARLLKLPWQPHVGTIEGVDVGADVEVRCRRIRSPEAAARGQGIGAGLLSLNRRDEEKGDKAFVIVHRYGTDPAGQLSALGWRIGWDVMQDKYWQADPDMPDGVYRLPHAELRPMARLHDFLDFRREQRHDDRLAELLNRADGHARDERAYRGEPRRRA